MHAVFLANAIVIAIVVMIHYEFLFRFTAWMPKMKIRHSFRILAGVFCALATHTVEIWIFGFTFWLMHSADGWGELRGNFDNSLLDAVYFSFTSYTTLGTGDIHPFGALRFLSGLESLTGLVLITWTASFLYLEMTRYWYRE